MVEHSRVLREEASADDQFAGFFRFVSTGLLLVILVQSLVSQEVVTVQSIAVTGNKAFSTSEILSWLQLKSGKAFTRALLDEDIKIVKERYAREGFLFAEVDSVSLNTNDSNQTVDIVVRFQEGKPAVIRSIAFDGNKAIPADELLSGMASKARDRFRRDVIERDAQSMLKRYEQSGYPFAKIAVKDISIMEGAEEYHVDVILSVDEGEAVKISEIRIEGNTTTKDYVVLREARLQPDEIFKDDLPVRIRQRLQRLQLFSSVPMPELYLRENGIAGLLIRVTEGNPNHFDGIVGYVPSSRTGESGYFTGLVNVQFRNLFGTGRKLSTRWYRENQTTQEIELRYHEPWIASYPVNGEVGFFQRKQDSTYVRRNYDLHAEFMLTEEFRVGASFAQADVFPSENHSGFVAESHATTVGGFLFYDSRDDIVTPTKGILYRTEFHTGTKKRTVTATPVTNTTQRFEMDLEHYLSLFQRQVLSSSLHLREFRSGGIEISDLFRLGGTTTVRGYREGQFLGSRLVWSNFEYRFLVAPRSFLVAFADAAYIVSPNEPSAGLIGSEQTKIGYGVGLRFDTALGLMGVSLAFGQGDTFSTAKLHVRLVNEF